MDPDHPEIMSRIPGLPVTDRSRIGVDGVSVAGR
jgi:hypothetical protein